MQAAWNAAPTRATGGASPAMSTVFLAAGSPLVQECLEVQGNRTLDFGISGSRRLGPLGLGFKGFCGGHELP